MYNEIGYKEYWGIDESGDIENFVPGLDITKTLLSEYCPGFPVNVEQYEALSDWQQSYIDKAVYIQLHQVLAYFDWYVNGTIDVITHQSVGRTTISYDAKSMTPPSKTNKLSKSMLDMSMVCDRSIGLYNGGCGC